MAIDLTFHGGPRETFLKQSFERDREMPHFTIQHFPYFAQSELYYFYVRTIEYYISSSNLQPAEKDIIKSYQNFKKEIKALLILRVCIY